jgi:hypothetical protein
MGRLARTPHSLATSTPTKPPPVTAGAFVFVKSRNQKAQAIRRDLGICRAPMSVLRDDRSAEMVVHAGARRIEIMMEAICRKGRKRELSNCEHRRGHDHVATRDTFLYAALQIENIFPASRINLIRSEDESTIDSSSIRRMNRDARSTRRQSIARTSRETDSRKHGGATAFASRIFDARKRSQNTSEAKTNAPDAAGAFAISPAISARAPLPQPRYHHRKARLSGCRPASARGTLRRATG